MSELAQSLDSIRGIDLFLRRVAELGARLLGVSYFGIWRASNAGDLMLPRFIYGPGRERVDGASTTKLQPREMTIIQRIFEEKNVIETDWAITSRTMDMVPLIPGSKASILCAIRLKERLIGLLHADDTKELRKWTANDVAYIDMLAGLTLLALRAKPSRSPMKQRPAVVEALTVIGSEVLALTENSDSILCVIVEKARQLLDGAISYVAAIDKTTNELYIKVSSGGMSEEYRKQRRPANQGLAGWVLREKKPAACSNYKTDPRHIPDFLPILRKEGIKSLLAVPLIVEGQAIGALFVCRRSKSQFSSQDVILACAFANMASIALQNSRLYSQQQRANAIHRQFIITELTHGGVASIANTLSRLTNNPVVVEDRYGELLAVESHEQKIEQGSLEDATKLGILSLAKTFPEAEQQLKLAVGKRESRWITTAETGLKRRRLVTPIVAQDEILGYLSILEIGRKLDALDVNSAEYAALVIALDMIKQRSVFDAEQRAKGDFLGRLLHGDYDSEAEIIRQASCLGYNVTGMRRVMVVRFDSPAYPEVTELPGEQIGTRGVAGVLNRLLHEVDTLVLTTSPQSITTMLGEQIVIFVVSEEGDGESSIGGIVERLALDIKQLAKPINHERTVSVGIGGLCHKPVEYKKSYEQARKALNIASWLGKTDEIVSLEALGIYGLLFEPSTQKRLSGFSQEVLAPLIQYDHEHNTRLLHTLSSYFKCSSNLRKTAGLLFVHLNTVRHRLERIQQLCKVDLGDEDDKLALQLAIKVWEIEQAAL